MDRRTLLRGLGAAAGCLSARGWAGQTYVMVPQVLTTNGPVRGDLLPAAPHGHPVAVFKGIPYGADTRSTRFQPPQKPQPWGQPLACISWARRAPQQSPDRPAPVGPGPAIEAGFRVLEDSPVHYHLTPDLGVQSEDCLHLNVWSPRLLAGARKPLPVLVYVHGGAYNNGTVNSEIYDGTRLARTGEVVVVTVNHRLNALGFLYLGELPGLAPRDRVRYRESGNAGMLDLVLALEWVRDNIEKFGGDPARVTIFGQSGGGAKCATLMAMPRAHGLFHRVLTMSGQQLAVPPRKLATQRAITALAAMGLTGTEAGDLTPARLDALTLDQIQAGARSMNNWLPVLDGVVLTRNPFTPDAPPLSDAIPMILGNTRDEIYGSTAWQLENLTWETLPEQLGKPILPYKGSYTVEEIIAAYRGWYPAYRPVDVYVAALAAFRSWPGQLLEAERRAASPEAGKRTWVYQMDFASPTADGRSPHTEDIAFFFDNLELAPGVAGDSDTDLQSAQPLATLMSRMLIQYAKTGDPNLPATAGGKASTPHWPVYDLAERQTMVFDRESKVQADPRGAERRMVETVKYRQPGT
jgi:para-nitrobenzyl esterase